MERKNRLKKKMLKNIITNTKKRLIIILVENRCQNLYRPKHQRIKDCLMRQWTNSQNSILHVLKGDCKRRVKLTVKLVAFADILENK